MQKRSKNIFFFFTIIMVFASSGLKAQAADYSVQANIIYNFTKYVNWPAETRSGDFIIGVVGDSPFFDKISGIVSLKTVGNQKIMIKKFSCSETAYNCQILFINEEESSRIKKINSLTIGKSVLIVTERDEHAPKGSCINLLLVNDKIKLEINADNIEKRNMKIASQLLGLGVVVK